MAIEEMDDAVEAAVDPNIQFQGKQQFFWVAKAMRLLSEDERVAKATKTFMVKPYSPTNPKSGPEYLKNLRMFATLGSTKDTHGIAMHVSNKEMGPEHMSGWEFQNGEKAISFTAALEGEEDKVKLKYDKRNARFCSHALIVWLRTCEPFQARLEELIAENPNGHYTRLKDIIFDEGRVYLKASQVKDVGTINIADSVEPPTSIPPDVPPSDEVKAERKRKRDDKKAKKEAKANGTLTVRGGGGGGGGFAVGGGGGGGGMANAIANFFGAANGNGSGGASVNIFTDATFQSILQQRDELNDAKALAEKRWTALQKGKDLQKQLAELQAENKKLKSQVSQGSPPPAKRKKN